MSSDDFTDREKELMALAWQCFEEAPKMDFSKLAGLAGMTNDRSAANAWARIKKKLTAQAAAVMGTTPAASSTPAKAKATPSKKRVRAKKAADENDDDEETTPAKKVSAGGSTSPTPFKIYEDAYATALGGKTKVKAESKEDDEDSDYL